MTRFTEVHKRRNFRHFKAKQSTNRQPEGYKNFQNGKDRINSVQMENFEGSNKSYHAANIQKKRTQNAINRTKLHPETME